MESTSALVQMADQPVLDVVAEPLADAIRSAYSTAGSAGQVIKNAMHGVWLGHPLHPVFTDIPLGAWTTGLVLDAVAAVRDEPAIEDAADMAIAIGLVGAAGAALTGLTDWSETSGTSRRTGLLHGLMNIAATTLYAGAYLAAGFVFSDALGTIVKNYQAFSRVLSWVLIAAVVGYLGFKTWLWIKARGLSSIPFVSPADAARAFSSEEAVIYDVRSHGYYDRKARRVKGSKRLEPNALGQSEQNFPAGKQIYLYCTCVDDATSARVAQHLLAKGVPVAVIKGGLRAWRKAGLPLETVPAEEMTELPVFNS